MAQPPDSSHANLARKLLQERRHFVRFPAQLDVLVRTGGGGKTGVEWRARVRDISTKGIGLVLPRTFAPGTVLFVSVAREGNAGEPFRMKAQVMRVVAESCGYFLGCQLAEPLNGDELTALIQ